MIQSQVIDFRPIGRRIHVRKCLSATVSKEKGRTYFLRGNIAIPEQVADTCNWGEIVAVANDCKLFLQEHVGKFVRMPEWKPNMMSRVGNLGDSEEFVIREELYENGEVPAFVAG